MKRLYLLLFLFIISLGSLPKASHGQQSIEILAGDTFNGAMNGVILGGATMALQNSNDIAPARVGLGAGTLFGLGVGAYDVSQVQGGQQFYLSGTFNDGTNSSVLVLLDTIYGAAGGALIASSISLIIQEPLADALQYGTAIGAWTGFGYGLFDAFINAEGPDFSQQLSANQPEVSGILSYHGSSNFSVGMLSPKVFHKKNVTSSQINQSYTAALDVLQINLKF